MTERLPVHSFGPFTGGVVDGRNPLFDEVGVLRRARHLTYSGQGRLRAGPGSSVAITLMDDQGTPAEVSKVLAVQPFGDGVLAVAWSESQQDVYLYRLDAALTGWYDLSSVFTASATATPLATVLWSAVTTPPVVTISEVSGVAWIASSLAITSSALVHATRVFNGSGIANLTADLDATGGAETVYALGTFVFEGHRWIWGFDKTAVAATAYRPELLRHGGPDGASLTSLGYGSFTIGNRLQSARERIINALVVGQVCYIGTPYSVSRIVGSGRDTWDKKPLDESHGFVSMLGQCALFNDGYYWSPRGPMKLQGLSAPEPLWDRIPETVASVVDPEKIVAVPDPDRDRVLWFYRGAGVTGNRLVCAYDARRDRFLGPDSDTGILVGCAGLVAPVTAPTAAAASGPAGAPTSAVTSGVSGSSATASWTTGDAAAETVVEVRQQGTTTWTPVTTLAAGVLSVLITGLLASTAYEWRAYHRKNGSDSSALGPVAGSQFTTTAQLAAPSGLTLTDVGPRTFEQGWAQWTNSGESGVSTEVYLDGVLVATLVGGESSYYVSVSATDTYEVTVRHTKSGFTASALTAPASATLTYGGAS